MKTKDLAIIVSKTNGRCFYCNKPGQAVDHFISRADWKELEPSVENLKAELPHLKFKDTGVDDLENLFLACQSCNSRKGRKDPEEFAGAGTIERSFRANKRVGIS